MTALPPIANFTDAAITEGEFKTALANMHLYLSGLLGTTGAQDAAQAGLGAIHGAGRIARTTAYTVALADRGKTIDCTTGTFTVTLPDAGSVGDGFAVSISNRGAGVITVDPVGSQTIDGVLTVSVSSNAMIVAVTMGGVWMTAGASVPSGVITMWSGSIATIPGGWALCNGANGTPDLRDRFVIAAGGAYAVGATGNGSIPSHTHTASTNSTGAHTHTTQVTAANNDGSFPYLGLYGINGIVVTSSSAGAHSHTVTVAAAGTGTTNIAVHYALAYIMKV